MNSRSWGPGTPAAGAAGSPHGDGAQEVDRGGAGELAPATGSARMVIGFAAIWLATVSGGCWLVFSRQADGLLLLSTVFVLVLFWAAGVFTRAFWLADTATAQRWSAVDDQVDFVHSVEVDIASINDRL